MTTSMLVGTLACHAALAANNTVPLALPSTSAPPPPVGTPVTAIGGLDPVAAPAIPDLPPLPGEAPKK
ncbi:MAG: hypothetical protein EB060_12535, partial [Proteobacteria bacterium]|nr:hypothetical protein [Pseudomonadota bacterium]